jgi:hypothetical protein
MPTQTNYSQIYQILIQNNLLLKQNETVHSRFMLRLVQSKLERVKSEVLGEEDYPFYTMDVPLYRLVVADNLSGESGMTSYLVTRDAPVINVKGVLNGKNYNIINTAFEPAIPQGSYYLRARGITQSEVVWSALQS